MYVRYHFTSFSSFATWEFIKLQQCYGGFYIIWGLTSVFTLIYQICVDRRCAPRRRARAGEEECLRLELKSPTFTPCHQKGEKCEKYQKHLHFPYFPAGALAEQWTSQNSMFSWTRLKRRRKKSPSPTLLLDSRRSDLKVEIVVILAEMLYYVSIIFFVVKMQFSGFPRHGPDWQLRLALPGALLYL